MVDVPYLPGDPFAGSQPALPPGVPSITEDAMMTALGNFLEAIMPPDTPVSQGQPNRVPMPIGENFVIMTPGSRTSLSTSYHDNVDLGPDGEISGHVNVQRQMSTDIQIDLYGPNSGNNAQCVVNLFRDDFAVTFLDPYGIAPLYCNDGNQMPLVNGEFQYEQRWTIMATLQLNPYVSTPMLFADKVTGVLREADQ